MRDIFLLTIEYKKFATDRRLTSSSTDSVQILPIIRDGRFTFIYQVDGICCEDVNEIFIKSVQSPIRSPVKALPNRLGEASVTIRSRKYRKICR